MTTHTRTPPLLFFHLATSSIYIFCLVHHTCNQSFSTLSVKHSENTSSTPLSQYHMLAPLLSSSALRTTSKLAIVFVYIGQSNKILSLNGNNQMATWLAHFF